MLRIDSQSDARHTILELHGSLAGPWVQELEKCWRTADRERPLKILICAVSFIDDRGKELLAEMYRSGAELVAEGCMNQAIVEEIQEQDESVNTPARNVPKTNRKRDLKGGVR